MFDLVPFRFNDWERHFFPDFFRDDLFSKTTASFKTDIRDNGKEYLIEAELPGFAKEEINVEVDEDRLTIAAKRAEDREEKKDDYLRRERWTGEVMRRFILNGVDRDQIKAEFKEGILKLTLPKAEETVAKPRRIDVH